MCTPTSGSLTVVRDVLVASPFFQQRLLPPGRVSPVLGAGAQLPVRQSSCPQGAHSLGKKTEFRSWGAMCAQKGVLEPGWEGVLEQVTSQLRPEREGRYQARA